MHYSVTTFCSRPFPVCGTVAEFGYDLRGAGPNGQHPQSSVVISSLSALRGYDAPRSKWIPVIKLPAST